jgi:acyl-coenzyme A synthetase/AMP-(fatty) acid ligase
MTENWTNLTDAVFHLAKARPDAPALTEGVETVTYGEFASLIAKAATYLRMRGVEPGERVGIAMMNGIDHFILLMALMRLGAVPIEMSTEVAPEALIAPAKKYAIRRIVTDPNIGPLRDVGQYNITFDWRALLADLAEDKVVARGIDELHTVNLTSGSTGIPSGVVNSHRTWLTRVEARQGIYYPQAPGKKTALPDFILTASIRNGWFFACALAPLLIGGRLIILPEYGRPIELARTIASLGDAICCATSGMCRFFLTCAATDRLLFPKLRMLEVSGLPTSAEEKRALIARVNPNFRESYGTAGFGMITSPSSKDLIEKPSSVGRPVFGVEIQIVDEAGKVLEPGVTGRLRLRGPAMSKGSVAEDQGNSATEYFRDGWYYPGDLASIDQDGYLYLTGRAADVIKRRGVQIYPPAIEHTLMAHPKIAEAVVIGRPAEAPIGEEVIAMIVPRGEIPHETIAAYCREKLSEQERPDRIFLMKELPRIAGGKPDRQQLKAFAIAQKQKREVAVR